MYIDIKDLMFNVYPIVNREFSLDYHAILYGDNLDTIVDNFKDLQDRVMNSKEFSIKVVKGDEFLSEDDEFIYFKEDHALRIVKSKNKYKDIKHECLTFLASKILGSELEIKKDYISRVKSNSIDYLTSIKGNCEILTEKLIVV